MSRQSLAQQEKLEAIDYLRTILEPGDTVYTILRHVSRSGMMRVIGAVLMSDARQTNGPLDITPWVAKALGEPLDRDRWGVKARGAGMDMGFAIVYDLSYQLFKNEFACIGETCPANDHSNGDQDYTPHLHSDAGYALRQKWM